MAGSGTFPPLPPMIPGQRTARPFARAPVLPKAADLAAEQLVADLCGAPDGILAARARLSGWLGAVGALLHDFPAGGCRQPR